MKFVNETIIGFGLTVLFSLVATFAYGETVINYDDGSTYTLGVNEKIYVSSGDLWVKRNLNNGKTVQIQKQVPWPKRDYVPGPEPIGGRPGEHEWCKAYEPWSEGLTFDMIAWQRYCDTNNDYKYGCGDDSWDNSEDGDACPSS